MPSESLIIPRRFLPAPFLVTLLGASGLLVATNTAPPLPPWNVPSRAALLKQIPLPPVRNSPEEKQDIAAVLKLQAAATPEQIALAKRDYHLSVFTFSEVYGKTFTPQNVPKTAALFRQLNDLVDRENGLLKKHFHRPHPFEVDPRVKRIVVAHPGYSYPSYHSARTVVFANVLSLLVSWHAGPADARRLAACRPGEPRGGAARSGGARRLSCPRGGGMPRRSSMPPSRAASAGRRARIA
jgi:membrane-associated phospholipid phosphatase